MVPAPPPEALALAARVRVIYADTDRMGVVYHGTYLRYLEHARVECIRATGIAYAEMERLGYGLPVVDLAVSYLAPARYDDLVSVYVAVLRVSAARVDFAYEVAVEPGDRHALDQRIVLLHALTKHACTRLDDGQPTRIPAGIATALSSRLAVPG
jgi:acyl-CoA thioester hydrolase